MDLREHLTRVQEGMRNVYNLANLSQWIVKHTKLDGKPFSFKDHEFQQDIIDDPAKTLNVVKCAQVGLSEIFARWGIAAAATQENFTLIWTFPNATDAEKFSKARLNPFIQSSPELLRSLSKVVDSTELKQFNANSFVYTRGTVSETGALSVPADLLIHDELDRSDMANIAAYVSRLQHKPTKMRRLFSTPTVAKYGIDKESLTSKRKRQILKCSHCNHQFLPSYEENIIIPGWDKPKIEINRSNLKDIRWQEARLLCPCCGKEPDQSIQYREWVVENPQENYDAVTYFVSPFCAPNILVPSYLVKASTDFSKWSEFQNQVLGLTAEDKQETLTRSDIEAALVQGDFTSNDMHFMGVDLGLTCHITIGKLVNENLVVVKRVKCHVSQLESTRLALAKQYRVIASVHDAFPYTDLVDRITIYDPNAYGAVYVTRASTELYTIKERQAEVTEGKLNLRAVHINRDVALDSLMMDFKNKKIIVAKEDDHETFVNHLQDMKRIKKFDKHGGIIYRWEKTEGEDHWHHSLLYCKIAASLRGTFTGTDTVRSPLVKTFKVTNPNYKTTPLGLRMVKR